MRPVLALILVAVFAAFAAAAPSARADTEKRVALIIGNDDYKSLPKLANAANDARAMDKALKAAGFETRLIVDGDRRQMGHAIEELGDKLASGAVGLFYYAGHGIQAGEHNYNVVSAKKGFAGHPAAWRENKIEYFEHDLALAPN